MIVQQRLPPEVQNTEDAIRTPEKVQRQLGIALGERKRTHVLVERFEQFEQAGARLRNIEVIVQCGEEPAIRITDHPIHCLVGPVSTAHQSELPDQRIEAGELLARGIQPREREIGLPAIVGLQQEVAKLAPAVASSEQIAQRQSRPAGP